MGKVLKGEAECLFCLRKLGKSTRSHSLSGTICQRNSINDKLMSFISPTDYRYVNDAHLFPNPKICSSCLNRVNSIHKNAVKIESLTGTRMNFDLDCEMAIEGNPNEKWPDVKQEYGSRCKTRKKTSLKQTSKPCRMINEEKNTIAAQNVNATGSSICVPSWEAKKDMQDSGEDTDNYYEGEDLMNSKDQGPNASSHQTWSVRTRSTVHSNSTQVPKLSLKLVKSNAINSIHEIEDDYQAKASGTSEIVSEREEMKRSSKTKFSKDKKKTAKRNSPSQNCQSSNSSSVLLSTDFLEVKDTVAKKKKDNKMILGKKQSHPCPHAGCVKAFIRPRDLKRHITLHTGEKPFRCEFSGCFKEYRSQNQLTVHKRVHTGERPYRCQYNGCDRQFIRLKALRLHETSHSTEQPFCCDECGKRFKHIRYLKLHKQSHKKNTEHLQEPPDKTIPCEICGKMFGSALNVRRHINLVHKGIKPKKSQDKTFVCEVNGCNRIFRWKSCMVRHKSLKHRKEDYKHHGKLVKYICEVEDCKKEFNRRRLLREHRISVHGKVAENGLPKTSREWLCPDCGMAVIKIQMSRHKDTYHSPGSMFSAEELGVFNCKAELCEMKFDSAEDLRTHVSSHIGNPPYKCVKMNCKKTFHLKKNLDIHMMIHDDIKPYQCKSIGCDKSYVTQLCLFRHSREHNDGLYVCPVETCGAKFRNMNNAGGHLASHRGEDPYVCGLCGAVFKTYNVWSRHKKKHTAVKAEKRIKCYECGKCFAHTSELKRHLPVHSEEKPYTCEVCGMGYASKGGYKGHMLTHEEKKYICKIEGCKKRFTLPLTFKRHQAIHERSNELCSSCGKILKVSLKKHKCPILKEDGDEKQTHSETKIRSSHERNNPVQQQELSTQVPSITLNIQPQEFQEYDQSYQLLQQQQSLHVHQQQQQQQMIHQQFQHQQGLQERQQQQHHHVSHSFQSGLQLSVPIQQQIQQQNQPLVMSHQIGVSAMTDSTTTFALSGNVGGFGPDNDVTVRQNQPINSSTPMSNVPANCLHSIPPFLPLPPSMSSSIPLTQSFPISPTPVNLPPVPLASLTSQQPIPLPSLSLGNDSLPLTPEHVAVPLQNFDTATSFMTSDTNTTSPLQPLSHSLTTALAKIDSDYY